MRYLNEKRSFQDVVGGLFTPCTGLLIVLIVTLSVAFVALFVLHSLFIWLSTDPERAFHNAKLLTEALGKGWDGIRFVWNSAMLILESFAGVSNRVAKHVIEPSINIGLEVLSQIALQKHYEGIIQDSPDSVPFRGHYCAEPSRDANGKVVNYDISSMTMQSLKFCSFGDIGMWADSLNGAAESDPAGMLQNSTTLLLSTEHARKLAQKVPLPEAAAGTTRPGDNMFPRIPLGPVLGAVNAFLGLNAVIFTTSMDIQMHVIYTIMSEMAVMIFNLIQVLLKALISLVQVIIRSGILQSLMRIGMDLLMTLLNHVLMPLIFAFLDMVMCLFGFAQPATWDAQLICSTCLPTQTLFLCDALPPFKN